MQLYVTHCLCGLLLLVLFSNGARSQTFTTSCGNSSTLTDVYMFGQSCRQLLSQYFNANFRPYYYYRSQDSALEYQNITASWNEICRWGQAVGTCYDIILPQCDAGIGLELVNNPKFSPRDRRIGCYEGEIFDGASSLQAFYRRTCQGQTVTQDIQQRIDDVDFDVNTTCLNATKRIEINQCFNSLREEIQNTAQGLYLARGVIRTTINRMAAATVNCMFSAINRSPCNEATKRVMYHVAKLQLPSFIDETELDLDETTTSDFSSILRCTVGVYGDPHLRECDGSFVTCSAPGNQVYLDNKWFTVTGTNQVIGNRPTNPPATSMRSIMITFRSLESDDVVATYTSQGGNLPTVFDNTNLTSVGQGFDRVTLTQPTRYSRPMFVQESTGMVLTLRQWNGNYFFTLRVAQNVIQNSHGLLASGCPTRQTIRRVSAFGRPAFTKRQAVTQQGCEQACNDSVTDPGLKDICAFDCYVTEDIQFGVNMTVSAEEDNMAVVEMDAELIAGAITPAPTTQAPQTTMKPSSATRISLNLLLTAVGCFLFATIV